MNFTLLSLFAIISILYGSVDAAPNPKKPDGKLMGAIVLARHASRPAFRQHGHHFGLPRISEWDNADLHLLEESDHEMKVFADALMSRYSTFISSSDDFKVVSSNKGRTIQSAQKVIDALGISKQIELHNNDKADMPFSKNPPECARYEALFKELKRKGEKEERHAKILKEYIEERNKLKMDAQAELFHVVGHLVSLLGHIVSSATDFKKENVVAYAIGQTAAGADYKNVPWATELVNNHYDLIENYMSEVWLNHVKGTTLARLFVGPMLNAILKDAEDITKEELKMSLIFSHDSTITGVLKALGANPVVAPGFGGSVSFEIWKSEMDFSVRVLYAKNFELTETPVVIGSTLTLDQLNENLEDLKISLDNWKKECANV